MTHRDASPKNVPSEHMDADRPSSSELFAGALRDENTLEGWV